MSDSEFDPERIFAAFSNEDVRFILIGGMAAILHGDAGVTIDIDIVPAVDSANLDLVASDLVRTGRSARISDAGTSGATRRRVGSSLIMRPIGGNERRHGKYRSA